MDQWAVPQGRLQWSQLHGLWNWTPAFTWEADHAPCCSDVAVDGRAAYSDANPLQTTVPRALTDATFCHAHWVHTAAVPLHHTNVEAPNLWHCLRIAPNLQSLRFSSKSCVDAILWFTDIWRHVTQHRWSLWAYNAPWPSTHSGG